MRNNPKPAHLLRSLAITQRFIPVREAAPTTENCVMDRQRCPQSEAMRKISPARRFEVLHDRRKNQQRERIPNKNRSSESHLFIARLAVAVRMAAQQSSSPPQIAVPAAEMKSSTKSLPPHLERNVPIRNPNSSAKLILPLCLGTKSAPPAFQHFVQIQAPIPGRPPRSLVQKLLPRQRTAVLPRNERMRTANPKIIRRTSAIGGEIIPSTAQESAEKGTCCSIHARRRTSCATATAWIDDAKTYLEADQMSGSRRSSRQSFPPAGKRESPLQKRRVGGCCSSRLWSHLVLVVSSHVHIKSVFGSHWWNADACSGPGTCGKNCNPTTGRELPDLFMEVSVRNGAQDKRRLDFTGTEKNLHPSTRSRSSGRRDI